MLRVACHHWHDLHSRGSGADHRDALVAQLVEPTARAAAGVLVVPSAAVELLALELLNTRNAGKFGPVQRSGARGEGVSVYFRDPDGSLLEFISYNS